MGIINERCYVLFHVSNRLIPFLTRFYKSIDHQSTEYFLSLRVLVHRKEELANAVFKFWVSVSVGNYWWNAIRL